ncbi:MAG TPA: hypothetical protein VED41_12570 [Solirubrobacteraceae bacterium]|nr:hypothetical protein [Solirubrobacteraceae bacterium]
MSTPQLRRGAAVGGIHPAVFEQRMRELGLIALTALIPATLALGVTVALPQISLMLVLAVIAGVLAIVAMMVTSRMEVTVSLLAVYLLMLDGPVKLLLPARELTASMPNVLIFAVCAGALMRLVVRRERPGMPPLSGWVLGFVGIVVVESFNPHTEGVLKILAGFREELQWVPFFWFGYLLMRSKRRLRQLFLIVGVAALANGLVSAYQTRLSPTALAAWGPGYHLLIYPSHGASRVYTTGEGEARVRPPGLGSDEGFGAGVGQIALPFALALLAAAWRPRRRWVPILLCLGALLAIITGLGRSQIIGGALAALAFALLAARAGPRVRARVLGALATIGVLAVPCVVGLVLVLRHGTFSRYESIASASRLAEAPGYKNDARSLIFSELEVNPFGVGLGTAGPTSGVGGASNYVQEQYRAISDETEFNVLANEVGIPGDLMWLALSLYMLVLCARGMKLVQDRELALYLAGVLAAFPALFIGGFSGALNSSAAAGPYYWFAIGVAAYWFVGSGRRSRMMLPTPDSGGLAPGSMAAVA